jgi:hypothetical protein
MSSLGAESSKHTRLISSRLICAQQHINDEGERNSKDFLVFLLAAEIVRKFSSRLAALHVNVGELTGNMQLTKV